MVRTIGRPFLFLAFLSFGMARHGSKLPLPLQAALAGAIRSALAFPTLCGINGIADFAADLGRTFGALPFNRKRLARAEENLVEAYPSMSKAERRALALESYGHIFRLGIEFAFMPRLLNFDGWVRHLTLGELAPAVRNLLADRPCVLITGHIGNWELIGSAISLLGFPLHAVYRPLDLKPLDRWVRESRSRQGLTMVSKFGAVGDLPAVLKAGKPIGLVADQNGGDRGVFVPCFGRLTSTYKSIGLMALQHEATVICGCARRDPTLRTDGALGYRMEVTDIFGPQDWSTHPDPLFYLTARYRKAMEAMIRTAPEQYLWMHRIWRSRPPHERLGKPFPQALREKMELLPWMTPDDVARVIDRSDRAAREQPVVQAV